MSFPGVSMSGHTPYPKQQEMSADWEPVAVCIDENAAIDAASGPGAPTGIEAERIPAGTLIAKRADKTCYDVLDSVLLDNAGADEQPHDTVKILIQEVTGVLANGGAIAAAIERGRWTSAVKVGSKNRLYYNGARFTQAQLDTFNQRLIIATESV